MLSLLVGLSWATSYEGLPIEDPKFGKAFFQSHEQGWYTHTPNGILFVYVGYDQTETTRWFESMQETHKWRDLKPLSGIGDAAFGQTDQIVLARFGNLGLLSWCNENAEHWIRYAESQAIKGVPIPPKKPTIIKQSEEEYRVEYEGIHMQYMGGKVLSNDPVLFKDPPHMILIWDMMGRSMEQYFSEANPVPPPQKSENSDSYAPEEQ